jgi:hypothetical protein
VRTKRKAAATAFAVVRGEGIEQRITVLANLDSRDVDEPRKVEASLRVVESPEGFIYLLEIDRLAVTATRTAGCTLAIEDPLEIMGLARALSMIVRQAQHSGLIKEVGGR